jgi:hypothetical protein
MTHAMRRLSRLLWWSSAVLVLAPARAGAAEVEWHAPDSCPDDAELRFRIERAIGMPLSHAAALRFLVTAERLAGGYVARLAVEAGPEEAPRQRVLVAPDCSRLADLVSVTAAIALGASDAGEGAADGAAAALPKLAGSAGQADGAAAPAVNALRTPPPATGVDALAASSARSPATWTPALSLWFLADAGSLPSPGAGLALGAGVEHAGVQLRALGTWLFEQRAALQGAEAPGLGAELTLFTGALSVCAAPLGAPGSAVTVDGCAGWELGRLSGEGRGVLRPRVDAAWWSAPRLDLGLRWALGSTGLELSALLTLAVPLVREDFVLGELGSVHRPSAAVGRAALGLNWRLE